MTLIELANKVNQMLADGADPNLVVGGPDPCGDLLCELLDIGLAHGANAVRRGKQQYVELLGIWSLPDPN
ncbi:hypothetical protein H1O16_gp331 [Burkholderia phage BcepSaruman]|uniref:Uncharacterized protein n=1 Tax=Burkholderia phage BcepSaruman TaxID=2530032 RepID=A0A4D5ZCQ9_9CAUD|nr:hypothetical protein H1O16_gp331 [Burkholderia phage BcepSaruman]QBX06744.1 hypothetical protein BcepSaruman_331 [Burkholderia phage BcepSaruman]